MHEAIRSRLKSIRFVATDLDGTLTVDRQSHLIPPETIAALSLLREHDVKVVVVTASGFPIALGVSRYLGVYAVIAENGCVRARVEPQASSDILVECRESFRWLAREVARACSEYLRESWQNEYRRCDFALVPKGPVDQRSLVEKVKEIVSSLGLEDRVKVSTSGYALHLTPVECSKRGSLLKLLEEEGASPREVLGIGDSLLDVEFVSSCGVSVAVANADEELRKAVHIVTKAPSGYGFLEIAKAIVEARRAR